MAQRSSGWGTWLLLAWGAGVLGYGLWQWSHLAFALALAVAIGIFVKVLLNRRQRRLRGYWVEYVSPAVVRAGEHEFAIVYHEGPEKLYFYGLERPQLEQNLLYVPGDEWDEAVEPWARGRRELIVDRLKADPIVKHCALVENKTT